MSAKITREQWLKNFIDAARPVFKKAGAPLPKEVRASIGFPSKGMRAKTIGECWESGASADKHAEIFIRPSLQASASRIADVLTHELIHAAVGHEAAHGPVFKRAAIALGLEGKMTATVAGPKWHEWADPIVKKLGRFPGAELKGQLAGGKKKQTTRLIKLVCETCEWTCRTTNKHIEGQELQCPTGCGDYLQVA